MTSSHILFIPGILTFITRFVVVADYGLLNSYWVLILPSIAGQQVFQIFVLRSFFAAHRTVSVEWVK